MPSPSPSLMERGKRCWRMASEVACGQIGCNCGAFAPYFLGFSLSLPVEAVFKGVQIVHVMLSLMCVYSGRWVDDADGRGRETPSALIYSFPAKRSGSYAWVVQATRSEGRHSGVGQCIRAMGTGQQRRALASRLFRWPNP